MSNAIYRSNFRSLIGVAFGLITLSVAAIGLTIWGLRSDAIQEANTDTGNIAAMLSEQLARSIQSIDIVLSDVREQAEAPGSSAQNEFDQRIRSHEFREFLIQRLGRLSQTDFIGVMDSDGMVASTTRPSPTPIDRADRGYFQHFKHENDNGLFISNLVMGRTTGVQTIFFSKRIRGENNEFLGVVVVGLRLTYFEGIYNSITLLHNQSFQLLHPDGSILISYPDAGVRANQKIPAESPWYQLVAAGGGHYRSPRYFDDQARLVSVQPLHEYPLVINVAESESAALGNWYRRATLIAIGTVLALICSAVLFRLLSKQFHRLFLSEAALAEREISLADKTCELQSANDHIDAALNNMSQGLCMFDDNGRLILCNERYIRMYGLSADVIKPGCALREMLEHRIERGGQFANDPTEYEAKIRAAAHNKEKLTVTHELQDGRVIEVVNQPMANGGWVATHDEITERKRSEAKIAYLAHHDILTGLPNRAAFNECFATTLDQAKQSGEQVALMCLDLDRFKYVNDLFGHAVGDALLCESAKRVKAAIGAAFLARIGGDEFTVIMTGTQLPHATARLAERIVTALGDYIEIDGRKLAANVSVGVAIYPSDATDGEKLISNADAALYRAKAEGPGSYRFFEPEMDRQWRESREIQHELMSALAKGEFHLVYQPEALIDGTIIGFEALVRWHHPTRGLIPPSTFIPLAEDGGSIIPLGEWILRTACREAASWKSKALLAVNLSAIQFRHGDLPGLVHTVLLETGLSPSRLEFEITESVLIDDFGRAQSILRRLKTLGVKIAMDDFGTGYSSLSYLQSFPFDKIKIDRSFVSGLEANNNNAAIVHAVITLAQSLNLPVLAEGVETEAQRLILIQEDCNQIQGYLIGKPLPIQNYESVVNGPENDKTAHYTNQTDDKVSRSSMHSLKRTKPTRRALTH